jgi:hypothetical protein
LRGFGLGLQLLGLFGEQAFEHTLEDVDVLRARHRPLAVEHKRRDGSDSNGGSLCEIFHHLAVAGIGIEERTNFASVKPDLSGARNEHVGVADV